MKGRDGDHMTLLIRVDGSTTIGTGHVMRCLALAQAWQDRGGNVQFALARATPSLEARLQTEGMGIAHIDAIPGSTADAAQTIALAREIKTTWMIVDGYHFDAAYQQTVKIAGLRLLFVDDFGHASHYCADIVLNQNISADASTYASCEPYTRLLLGARYALLRREFWSWRGWHRKIPSVARKVLITLGGSDPENVTLGALEALENAGMKDLEAVVVVGGSSPHQQNIKSRVDRMPFDVRLVENASNMPELMAWADLAISAAGSTCWELALMGLPSILLIVAENQRPIAERLDRIGMVVNLGWHNQLASGDLARKLTNLLVAQDLRMDMSLKGKALVDGKGCRRIVQRLIEKTVELRVVTKSDCKLLWEWANDPDVRAASFSSKSIPWEEHVAWFRSRLEDPDTIIFIVEDDCGVPIGQVRFERDETEAAISISLDSRCRGRGFGRAAIRLASGVLFDTWHIDVIHAFIKPGNVASKRAFLQAGYEEEEMITSRGYPASHLSLRRGDQDERSD